MDSTENTENMESTENTDSIEDAERPELITATYRGEAAAKEGFEALRDLQKEAEVLLAEVALVVRDENDHLHVTEPGDMAAPEGALYGATIGAVVGMIAGPLGLVVGGALGALVGGAGARVSDTDIEDEWLKELGRSLPPGAGMVVAVTPALYASKVQGALAALGGNVMTRTLDPALAARLGLDEIAEAEAEDSDRLKAERNDES